MVLMALVEAILIVAMMALSLSLLETTEKVIQLISQQLTKLLII